MFSEALQIIRAPLPMVDTRHTWPYYFLKKVAATRVNLLFIELMLHLSRAKQMYSRPIHLTHKFNMCLQITRGRFDFNRAQLLHEIDPALVPDV